MFQNSRISVLLRIICLITFIAVIIYTNSFITLSLIAIYFYLFTRNDDVLLIFLWRFVVIIVFLISCFVNSFYLFKIVLIIGLAYYFIMNPYGYIDDEVPVKKKSVIIDKYMMRFKNFNIKRKVALNMNLINTLYVTVHLFILFITIMVG